jgi:hypothetical protein
VIVTLAPLQDSFTMTNINRCCYKLHRHVYHLFRGSRSHHSRFRRRRGYSGEYGCYAVQTILFSSDDYSWGGGGCSHCGRGPHAKAPQSRLVRLVSLRTNVHMSSWSLESTKSRRLLRSQICCHSSRRNSRIASLSCSTAGRVPGGMDVVAVKWTCDW